MRPEWYVYRHDFNADKIVKFNIFDHGGFYSDFKKYLKTAPDKKTFAENLSSSLMYYYWSKCEYEVLIAPWVGKKDCGIKVDIDDQIRLNWKIFVDYAWSFRRKPKEIKNEF